MVVTTTALHRSLPLNDGNFRHTYCLSHLAFSELKQVIVVDEDVNIFDTDDILWAMQTRYQGEVVPFSFPAGAAIRLTHRKCRPTSPSILQKGMTCKTIFDCTGLRHLKAHFERSKFKRVD